ncbi:Hypothetical_protein [Hexamita inflata]|uniref:Hypothetical_protein n=1 Tax=Hexamita inflata TaxID=28002 RepID=A0ABP1IKN2_9EUKA
MGFIDAFIHCWHYFCQVRSGNTDKLNIISFQQNQQHKINLSTQLIFYRILTKTVVQLKTQFLDLKKQNDVQKKEIDFIKQQIEQAEADLQKQRQYQQLLQERANKAKQEAIKIVEEVQASGI